MIPISKITPKTVSRFYEPLIQVSILYRISRTEATLHSSPETFEKHRTENPRIAVKYDDMTSFCVVVCLLIIGKWPLLCDRLVVVFVNGV